MRKLLSLGLLLACTACSEGTNINQLFVSSDQKNAVDYLIERGQYHYDRKEYDKALKYADKAYALNHDNEEAAILLAYTHLAIGGVDVFGLSENLIDQSESETKLAESSTIVGSLSKLGEVIGITSDDETAMTAENNELKVGTRTVKGDSDNPLFSDYPINLPRTAVEAREATSHILTNISKAIHVVCPFVDEAVKILPTATSTAEDPRHTTANCPVSDAPKNNGAKAHFIWALSHLAEGVAFNAFFGTINTGLTSRAAAIENKAGQNVAVADFVSGVVEISDIINIIMPTDLDDARESMLKAIFNDMDAATAAFAQMAGMPESLTKSITNGLTDLRAKSDQIGSSSGDKDVAALKNQLLDGTTKKIRDEMTKRDSTMSTQQKDDACKAYNSITTIKFDMCPRS